MRCVVRHHLRWFRLALLATISVAAAGCSTDFERFDKSLPRFGEQGASSEVTGSTSPAPQRHSSVQSAPLPPPNTAAMHQPASQPSAAGTSGGSRGMASYRPGQAEVTGSVAPPPAGRSHSGWSWEGGTAVNAAPGDTAEKLGHRYGVPAAAIIQANNLPNGSAIRPGQRLVIPKYEATGNTTAPRQAAGAPKPAPAIAAPGSNVVHVIAPGETLMKLSRQYHKPLAEIAKANNIPPHTQVKVGDRIVIPGVYAAKHPAKPQVQAAASKPVAPPIAQAPQPQPQQQAQKPAPQPKIAAVPAPATTTARMVTPSAHSPEPEKVKQDVTAAAAPTFRWPVRGRVIAGFGPKPSGQQNDGINVAVPEGTPVKAAEDGVVAYAGNELKTYGNLVLVRHSNGYVTAYAHASEILVKRDDPIKRGQVIAKSGQTGNVAAPQLHFEIRKGSTPIDPVPYLDKGGNG